jgi:putative ABC transport system permease protein
VALPLMSALPLLYNAKSAFVRKGATLLTVSAIAFSVAVLVLVLALARGFELALGDTGSDDNAILLRAGATSEGVSGIGRDDANVLAAAGFVARGEDGQPRAQPEIYAAFSLTRADGGRTNIPVRGTGPQGLSIRESVRISPGGRMFVPGRYEIVVGKALQPRLRDCWVGGALEIAGYRFAVVGVLDSGGQAYDSEIWIDVEIFLRMLDRPGFSTVLARLARPDHLAATAQQLRDDPRLSLSVKTERQYFAEQAGALGLALRVLAWFLAAIMGAGAVAGDTNTMLASVRMRTREIGTLLAIGFRPRAVFGGFLVESLLIALAGGALGVLLGYQCNGIATGTTNWSTFTEQSFQFRVTPDVVAQAMVLAVLIGVVGGALPARRAARLSPREALRTT